MEGATHIEFILICWGYMVTCYVVLLYISTMIIYLDEKWPWGIGFYERFVWQVFCCLFLPSVTFFGVFVLLSFILPLSLRESTFLYIDIYIVVLLLLIVNACYVIAFYMKEADLLREKLRLEGSGWEEDDARRNAAFAKISAEEKKIIQSLKEEIVVLKTKFDAYKEAATLKAAHQEDTKKGKVYFLKMRTAIMRIPHRKIALFFMRDGVPWIRLMDGEEYYATEKTLNEVHKTVGDDFFLVKRSFLINDNAIERCVRRKDKRLVLYLCDKGETAVLGPVEPDEKLEKRILMVVDIVAE